MNLQFKHALVALDQSEASDIIVDCLGHFEKFGTKKMTLFTSVSVPYPGGLSSSIEQKYKTQIENYRERLQKSGYEVQAEVSFKINAYAPARIMEASKELGADFIIIANRGYNKYREFLLGSTATELLQRCHLPVYLINLTVSDESELENRKLYCIKACIDSLDHIFYPTDFSTTSDRAFEVLKKLAPGNIKKVSLLHVQATGRPGMNDPKKLQAFDRTDTERLKELKTELEEVTDAEVSVKVRYGSPVKQILENSESDEATMILIGSQGRGYVSDLFLGGVCHQVIRKSHIPVLTIPADRDREEVP
jgi:nucleotide-binding universal stress UspA family protein